MTDQIYYKIQYPLKKAINVIKEIDTETPLKESEDYNSDREQIKTFLDMWENEGKAKIKSLIKKLRESK